MKKLIWFFVVVITRMSSSAFAQVDGLWLVTSVEVGSEVKTPVAKWFRLNNGKSLEGNGWQQHTIGSYKWNKKTSELSFKSDNEPSEGFGAFTVSRTGNNMRWTRMEEGETVSVSLKAITELPQSTADQVKGLWDLASATRSGADVTSEVDPEGRQYIFIRWDRMFVRRFGASERVQGYWFVNAHYPALSFIGTKGDIIPETWTVSFEEGNMVLTGQSENVKGQVLTFSRLSEFPK
jgi:hypothetical protein